MNNMNENMDEDDDDDDGTEVGYIEMWVLA